MIALELRRIERNVSSSASTVQLGKTKVITHLLTHATAFSGRNFHVTQRKSLEIQTRSITIRRTLLSWNIVKRQVPIGSFTIQWLEKKLGCPCSLESYSYFPNWQSSILNQICHVFNMRVHKGALSDVINYAQKGCTMQMWGITAERSVSKPGHLQPCFHAWAR